jgi:hypothetical protein
MGPTDRSLPRALRARRRLAWCLWLGLAFVVWNDVFDAVIVNAGRDYLTRKVLAGRGLSADVTVFGTMRPAISRGVVVASLWALPIAIFGVAATWYAARKALRAAQGEETASSGQVPGAVSGDPPGRALPR